MHDAETWSQGILESLTSAFCALDASYRFTHLNERAVHLLRRPRESLLGQVIWTALPELVGTETCRQLTFAMEARRALVFDAYSQRHRQSVNVRVHPHDDGLAVFVRNPSPPRAVEAEHARSEALVHLLRNVAVAANEASGIEPAFQAAIEQVCETIRWPVGHAFLIDLSGADARTSNHFWHCSETVNCEEFREASESRTFVPALPFVGAVLETRRAVWLEDVQPAHEFTRAAAARRAGLRAGVACPVLIGKEVVAVLEFFATHRVPPDAWILDALSQIGTQLGRVVERRRADTARHLLIERVVEAQEEERRRLSRDLHDKMGQYLTALALSLRALRGAPPGTTVDAAQITRMELLVDAMGVESRELALALRPTALDDVGLESAVREHTDGWSRQAGVAADLHFHGLEDRRLPGAVETTLYRIVQEALNNVARHAGASRVSVIIERRDDGSVYAIIEDDGIGFDPDGVLGGPHASRRLGLLGMQERATLAGGILTVESTSGEGTAVFVRFPAERTGVLELLPSHGDTTRYARGASGMTNA